MIQSSTPSSNRLTMRSAPSQSGTPATCSSAQRCANQTTKQTPRAKAQIPLINVLLFCLVFGGLPQAVNAQFCDAWSIPTLSTFPAFDITCNYMYAAGDICATFVTISKAIFTEKMWGRSDAGIWPRSAPCSGCTSPSALCCGVNDKFTSTVRFGRVL